MSEIKPYVKHLHSSLFEKYNSRDFHEIMIKIYNELDTTDKEKFIINFNSLITKWHYQPGEAWSGEYGVWAAAVNFLNTNSETFNKYPNIKTIFNTK